MARDRNEVSRQQFAQQQQIRQARQAFAQAVAAGTAGVLDKFGKRVEAGQLLHVIAPATGLVGEVIAVTPVMDPGAPPGLIKIEIAISLPLSYQSGVQARDLIVVGRQTAPTHAELETPQAQAPEPDAQPTEDPGLPELPNPDNMHGAGDGFGGEDFPSDDPPAIKLTDKD